jgi:hypothetical protein
METGSGTARGSGMVRAMGMAPAAGEMGREEAVGSAEPPAVEPAPGCRDASARWSARTPDG